MGRTMSGQEAFDVVAKMFFDAGVPVEDVPGPDALVKVGGIILAERAHSARLAERVAELEQMYAEMKDAADKGSKSVFALAASQAENVRLREVHVVFDGPPSHESGRFVECEDGLGNGISAGKWVQVGDLWHLVIANVLGPEVKP